jgi:hypothetical protein
MVPIALILNDVASICALPVIVGLAFSTPPTPVISEACRVTAPVRVLNDVTVPAAPDRIPAEESLTIQVAEPPCGINTVPEPFVLVAVSVNEPEVALYIVHSPICEPNARVVAAVKVPVILRNWELNICAVVNVVVVPVIGIDVSPNIAFSTNAVVAI